jgi:signal transduction histidine kinase
VEVEHADPGRRALARELLQFPRDPLHHRKTRPSLQGGRAHLTEHVDDALLERMAYDAEHLAILRALQPASCMDVPLVARGGVLGALVFVSDAASGRRYGPADLGLAEELARRAALSLDNARLYHEAQRATRMREEVLGVVSHDLRTPLSVISMHTGALEELGTGAPAVVRDAATGIRASIDWLQRMIRDLLDVASIDAGRMRLERRTRDPLLILMKAVDMLEPLAADAGLALRWEMPEHLPAVVVDEDRVLQVIANLVGNAIKFTHAGGCVTIRASSSDDSVRISVSDTGPGIAPASLARIFDRFWQDRGAANVRGTGLGLAIAKGLVEAHGGRLWVESVLGQGSTFHMTLPLPKVAAPDRVPASSTAAPGRPAPSA